jgi:hypothetical protein
LLAPVQITSVSDMMSSRRMSPSSANGTHTYVSTSRTNALIRSSSSGLGESPNIRH